MGYNSFMPELPEVETIARQLNKEIKGKRIEEVGVLRRVSFQGDEKQLVGKTIAKIDRHAKMIVWHLEDFSKVVMIHLKMTGQLIFDSKTAVGKEKHTVVGRHPTEDWIAKHPTKHTRVIVKFSDGGILYFNDLRVFGWMKLIGIEEFEKLLEKMPPDVNSREFTYEYFDRVVSNSARAIKLTVMDSTKVGGAGNIYANDALFLAGIDPRRKSKELTEKEKKKLREALIEVINEGIKYGGASASDYVQVSGLGGKYQDHFLVYNRAGKACEACGGKIKKIALGGRGTYFCENCQK